MGLLDDYLERMANAKDVKCPHCGHEQDIGHDGGAGWAEDREFDQFCEECEEEFTCQTSVTYSYEVITPTVKESKPLMSEERGEIKGELQSISLAKPESFVIKSWIGVDVKCIAMTEDVLLQVWKSAHELKVKPIVEVHGELQCNSDGIPVINADSVKVLSGKARMA